MALVLETGYTSLNKKGEELCGDKVEQIVRGDYTTLVLADGLGSGVKANILATLTSKILCTMVSEGIELEECIETVVQALPVCKVRGVAYSTFSVIHIDNATGNGYLFEFDNPQAIFMSGGKCVSRERIQMSVMGKTVYKTALAAQKDDVILLMSDGVIHAGIGQILNFGWQRKEVEAFLDKFVRPGMSARGIACMLAGACNELYLGEPGDDTTVAAVRIREELSVNIMVGPPVNKEQDNFYIARFLEGEGKKVVCGGTSSQIVARYLGTEVQTAFDFPDKEVPPIGSIEGIDLTTEGVLTLRKLLTLAEKYVSSGDLTPKRSEKKDGASLLLNMLFEEATTINFFVGQSVNAAHSGLPIDITMKLKLVESIAALLKKAGKTVNISYD